MAIPNPKWLLDGPQVILKSDFIDLENAVLGQPTVRLQPPLVWVDAATVRVEATPDCPAWTAFSGLPNILNPFTQVSGGLSDNVARGITANVSCLFASGGLYGTTQTEKASQWYAIFAVAADADTDFELKAMPIMRVKSQTGQAIKCGTLITPGTGINYGFTDNDLAEGMLYFQSGDSRGLIRTISANDVDTDTRITYSGDALTVAAGDWFIVLPPTNFRLLGTVFNDSGSDIVEFRRLGSNVQILEQISCTRPSATIVEDIKLCCPWAINARVSCISATTEWGYIGHASATGHQTSPVGVSITIGTYSYTLDFNLEFCRYYGNIETSLWPVTYGYAPGTGY